MEEMASEEFNECLKAARYIIKRRGVTDQSSTRSYVDGDLKFEHTNTNDIEVTIAGKVALFVPPVGSSKQVIWQPGDWVQEVYEVKEKTEAMEHEEEEERILRAEHYCRGYREGVYEGRDPTTSDSNSEGHSPSYRAGFGEGLAAARRAKYGQSIAQRNLFEVLSFATARLEGDYQEQGQVFTSEQSEEWKSVQANIKAKGEIDWQRILLELHLLLTGFESGAILTEVEGAAVNLLKTGAVRRLAKTRIALPKVG